MVITLASQAKDDGSIPFARSTLLFHVRGRINRDDRSSLSLEDAGALDGYNPVLIALRLFAVCD